MAAPDSHSATPPSAPPSPVRWLMLAGVWLIYFCFALTSSALAPLVAPITRDFAMSHSAMGGVLGIWQLVFIAAAVPCGVLLDRLGPRRALFLGVSVIALSGVARTLAVDTFTFYLAVAIFGLGGPIVSAGAPKVVSAWFIGRERGLAMGIYMTGTASGAILALTITNSVMMPLLDDDWRRVLLLWAAITFAAALVWLALTAHPAARSAASRASAEQRPAQLALIAKLLRLPRFRTVLLMAVGIFMFNHGVNNWLPELLRVGGMSASEAGLWAAVPTAIGIVGSLLIPPLATPGRRFNILLMLCALAAISALLLQAPSGPVLMAGLIVQGTARSALMTVAMLVLLEMPEVGERHAGTAGGMFFSAAEIGGSSGPLIIGVLYDLTGGFAAGLYMLGAVAVLLCLGALRLRRMA
jgi:MFS transporter, CP family, cyanate transporter